MLMIQFIDPSLKSSDKSKKITEINMGKLVFYLIVLVLVVLIMWMLVSLPQSQIDRKQDDLIHIDSRINSIEVPNRIDPIQNTK